MPFPAMAPVPAAAKRAALRAGLASGRLLRMPGAFSPLVARLVEELGFDGAYVSGAVVSGAHMAKASFTPVGNSAGLPAPLLRPSPTTDHDAEFSQQKIPI